ncbi:MAG: hypothetical protein FJ109_03495 [Deltaproteobacteria bacterium]|nr:hypothetical protein [Deltaproteobacteria bacterium]
MKPIVTAFALTVVLLAAAAGADAHSPDSPVSQGHFSVGLGGGLDSSSASVGLGFGYFVLDGLMPGVRYVFQWEGHDQAQYDAYQHDVSLYLRYFPFDLEAVLPFLVGEGSWLHYSQAGKGVEDLSLSLWSAMGGAGVLVFIARRFSVELMVGMRHYFDVPSDVAGGFDENRLEWNLGFGLYF